MVPEALCSWRTLRCDGPGLRLLYVVRGSKLRAPASFREYLATAEAHCPRLTSAV